MGHDSNRRCVIVRRLVDGVVNDVNIVSIRGVVVEEKSVELAPNAWESKSVDVGPGYSLWFFAHGARRVE